MPRLKKFIYQQLLFCHNFKERICEGSATSTVLLLLFSDHSDEVVILDLEVLAQVLYLYMYSSGFWPRVRARLIGPLIRKTGRCPPPAPLLATSLFLPVIITIYREIPAENPSSIMQLPNTLVFLPKGSGCDAEIWQENCRIADPHSFHSDPDPAF
jgi:hypothetical protein